MNDAAAPGLYVHVPFCTSKCPYCDFYSVTSAARVNAWLRAVQSEALLYRGRYEAFDTLYLGGGTPSLLQDQELTVLLDSLYRNFAFAADTEITIEVNPDDIRPERLARYRQLGINRISVGVQSFDDQDLRHLKRRHTAPETLQALEWIRACGFSNLGVDLIYGLQGQTPGGWLATLERALEFQPEHVSCYQLTLEPATPFGRLKSQGVIRPLEEELEREFFLLTSNFLEQKGYLHYEISNFAAAPRYFSRHNRKYWQHVPYLGLGPSAHSFLNGKRWWNVKSIEKYCDALDEDRMPVAGSETLSPEQIRLESVYLGIRTRDGFALEILGESQHRSKVLAQLQRSGIVRVKDGRVTPTREGFLVADSLPLLLGE